MRTRHGMPATQLDSRPEIGRPADPVNHSHAARLIRAQARATWLPELRVQLYDRFAGRRYENDVALLAVEKPILSTAVTAVTAVGDIRTLACPAIWTWRPPTSYARSWSRKSTSPVSPPSLLTWLGHLPRLRGAWCPHLGLSAHR